MRAQSIQWLFTGCFKRRMGFSYPQCSARHWGPLCLPSNGLGDSFLELKWRGHGTKQSPLSIIITIYHRFFPGISALERVVSPTTGASRLYYFPFPIKLFCNAFLVISAAWFRFLQLMPIWQSKPQPAFPEFLWLCITILSGGVVRSINLQILASLFLIIMRGLACRSHLHVHL
jgi:hypothetical protein